MFVTIFKNYFYKAWCELTVAFLKKKFGQTGDSSPLNDQKLYRAYEQQENIWLEYYRIIRWISFWL